MGFYDGGQCPRVPTAPTATGSTTWRGTCLSGAGTGMMAAITTPHPRPIPAVRLQPPGSACCGAARGTSARGLLRCANRATSRSGVRGQHHRISECEGALTSFPLLLGVRGLAPGRNFFENDGDWQALNMATSSHVLPREKSWATTLWSITSK